MSCLVFCNLKNKGLQFFKKTTRHFFVVFWQQSQCHTGRRTRHRVFILSCLSCFVVFALLIKIGYDLKQRLYICRRETQIYLYSES